MPDVASDEQLARQLEDLREQQRAISGVLRAGDVLADPEYTYPGPRFYRAMLGVPVMVDDDLIGVVVVVRRDPQSFTGEHVALVQTFADQAAIAIRNARLMGNRFGRPVPAYEVRGLAATP